MNAIVQRVFAAAVVGWMGVAVGLSPVLAAEQAAPAGKGDAAAKRAARKPRVKVTISKETTYITAPLRPDGYPDYVGAINERLSQGVTPENNGAVLFWRAFGPAPVDESVRAGLFEKLGIAVPSQGPFLVALDTSGKDASSPQAGEKLADQQSAAMRRPWSKEEFPRVARWLEKNEQPLRLIVDGTKRPRYYSPLVSSGEPPMITALLPGMQMMREAARALSCRAMLRLKEGKVESCMEDLLTCHRLGRMAGQGPTLIEMLVGIAIDGIADQGDAALIQHGKLTGAQARKLAGELDRMQPLAKLADKIDLAERFMYLDAISSVARVGIGSLSSLVDGGPGGGESGLLARLASNLLIDWDVPLRTGNRWYDRFVAAAKLPSYTQRATAMGRIDDDLKKLSAEVKDFKGHALSFLTGTSPRALVSQQVANIFAALMLPAVNAVAVAEERARMQFEVVRIGVALAAYRAEHGAYPDKLTQLSPQYLAKVPKDAFAKDGELRYRRQDGGFLLYSVGANGQDDGGRGYDDRKGQAAAQEWDDLVIRASNPPKP